MTITLNEFNQLASAKGDALISIYLPTHEAGPDIRQDHIRFKNLLNQLEEKSNELEHDQKVAVRSAVDTVRPLEDDAEFWRRQGQGLAIFIENGNVRMHRLPTPVNELAHVSDRYIVRPLLPAISTGQTFYILDLNEKAVRLIACTTDGARELDADDIPKSLKEALGYDVEQKSLQFHTEAQPVASPADRAAMFHGHGAGGEEDENAELKRFLEIVDNGVRSLLEGKRAPLVVAGVERVIATFQHVTHYEPTVDQGIPGNHEHQSVQELHQMALPIVRPVLDEANRRERERFAEAAHTKQAVAGLDHVLLKANNAQVETLFIDAAKPIWGQFEEDDGVIHTHDAQVDGDDDLLDRALHSALSTGAKVVATPRDQLPGSAPVAALLRFV
jgi:hypothetical protein